MPTPLAVILGAGASRRSADYGRSPLRPTLTVDLFDENLYGDQLRRHDLAHQAGRYITQERKSDNAIGLEQVLHSLRESLEGVEIKEFPGKSHGRDETPEKLFDLRS